MKLQVKIIVPIIFLMVLLLSLSGFLAYRQTANSLSNALIDNMRGESDALVRAVNALARNSMSNIVRTAENESVLGFYKGDIHNKEQALAIVPVLKHLTDSYADLERIILLDDKGDVVSSSDPQASQIGQKFGDRDYVRSALAGKPFLAAPFKSRVTNKTVMTVSAPVTLNGKIVGVAYAAISVENFFNSAVAPVKVGSKGFAYILDPKGLVAVVNEAHASWLFNAELPAVSAYKQWAAGTEGTAEITGNDGVPIVCYYKKDSFSNLTAVVRAESTDVFSGLHALRDTSIMIVIGSILAGSLLVFMLIRPIVKALNFGVIFAGKVAAGDLSGELNVRRNDEIGKLADALRAIPASLRNIVEEYRQLEKNIELGHLDAQGNAGAFAGEFATLIQGTNSILRRFRQVLDSIPSPVAVFTKDLQAAYLNDKAREWAGSEYKGKTCQQLFAREDSNTGSCALTGAVRSGRPATGETTSRPQGKTMDISYTVIPLLDASHNVASVLELLTDLTAIKSTQRIIVDVANQAMGISDRVATASEELSAQVEQVGRGTDVQRDRVSSTAAAMEEMNSTVLEVARNAGQAREQAENTQHQATQGSSLVSQVIQAVEQVNALSAELEQNMRDLGSQAEAIGSVMSVISDIADQTNLLALNAAIEAARAGEAGRGFAVVADEVRKLAEKTMSATSQVGTSITGIQAATSRNIGRVEKAAESVSRATELAGTSGIALAKILELSNKNAILITSIATAAEEQSVTSEKVNRSVEEINRIAADTSDGMRESAAAVQDLAHLAQELKTLLDKLKV